MRALERATLTSHSRRHHRCHLFATTSIIDQVSGSSTGSNVFSLSPSLLAGNYYHFIYRFSLTTRTTRAEMALPAVIEST